MKSTSQFFLPIGWTVKHFWPLINVYWRDGRGVGWGWGWRGGWEGASSLDNWRVKRKLRMPDVVFTLWLQWQAPFFPCLCHVILSVRRVVIRVCLLRRITHSARLDVVSALKAVWPAQKVKRTQQFSDKNMLTKMCQSLLPWQYKKHLWSSTESKLWRDLMTGWTIGMNWLGLYIKRCALYF